MQSQKDGVRKIQRSNLETRDSFRCLALLAAVCTATACGATRSARDADKPDFRGIYMMGPDRSAFRPCGSHEEWYVDTAPASAGWALQRRMSRMPQDAPPGGLRHEMPDAGGYRRAYVEVQGDTVALTAGPQVRRYTRELRLTRVLTGRRVSPAECP
jgi:hypothetical protein